MGRQLRQLHRAKLDVHLGDLGSGTTGDLLDTKRSKLSLELVQLLKQVGLVLGLELEGADLGRHGWL